MSEAVKENMSGMARESAPVKRSSFQNPYVLLFCILVLAGIATWILPAGRYATEVRNGIAFSVPGSYHEVARQGVLPQALFMAIAEGLIRSAPIVFMVLFTGGALHVLEQSGAVGYMLNGIAQNRRLNDFTLIVIFCVVFSILGTTGIIVNSVIAFVPIGIMVSRSIGLDKLFGVALVYIATYTGYNASISAPTSVGLAQRLADVPLLSGFGFRVVIFFAFLVASIVFMTLYARSKRRMNFTRPTEIAEDESGGGAASSAQRTRYWLALLFTALCLGGFIAGAVMKEWSEKEMLAMFVIMAIGVGLISRMSAETIANSFLKGCAQLVVGAFIVGLARAISIILNQGLILDTLVYYAVSVLGELPRSLSAIGMYVVAMVMHVFISSGSGESAVLVPVFTPIADVLGITRQTAVQAVVFGEGVVNCINPTSGVLMAILATAKIPYTQWVRFVLPLVVAWGLISAVALFIAVEIKWGPI